jgi:hypothetical protein
MFSQAKNDKLDFVIIIKCVQLLEPSRIAYNYGITCIIILYNTLDMINDTKSEE